MADRSSDESSPDRTDVRSTTTSKAASGTRTTTSSSSSQSGKPAQRKTTQPRKSPAKKTGSTAGKGSTRTTGTAAPGAQATPRSEAPTGRPEEQTGADPQGRPESPQTVHERINAAYASSGPVVPDDAPVDPDRGRAASSADKPTGSERFAAALGRTPSGTQKSAQTSAEKQGSEKSRTPRPWDAPRRVRKARLRVTHVDPWSVLKTAFLLAVAIGIVTVVAVAVVWSVLDAAGVWGSIDKAVADVVGETGNSFRIEDYLGLSRVLGFTLIVAVVDVVLVTVIATLGAFLYNLAAALLGGVEVVLAEEER